MDVRLNARRRQRTYRRVTRQLDDYDDDEMRRRYRFGGRNLDRLEDLLRGDLERPTARTHALTVRLQILVALRFYASGCFLQIIGDTFGLDIATVSRCVTDVTDALFRQRDRHIKFPMTADEKLLTKTEFYQMHGFPCVIGLIDCTHIRIISPPEPVERAYVNRKKYHSLNVQATCDHQGKFTSINSVWPGASHDSHIFRASNLAYYFETQHHNLDDGVLLGDSGYPCRPFLMTPFLQTDTVAKTNYNRSHIKTRNLIERVFGMWKRKFHVLHSEVRMKAKKVSRIVIACAVLYNLRLKWNEPDGDDEPLDDDQPPADRPDQVNDGRSVRDHIVNTYF